MPLQPVSRRVLIRKLRNLGFEGPFSGGRHSFMTKARLKLVIPNEHRGVIGRDLLSRILRRAEVSHDDWNEA
ncbi:MAG: type II toxin-antitoxin system HicA family toxin [Actinomycetota bacterium]|nr:type II toxin-antitoxin system HicA family toxin [Actinomycetota bacterium]